MVAMLDLKLWRDLRSMWAQVVTIALVVGCGIAAFIGSLSTYESIKDSRDHYYLTARFGDVFSGVKRAPDRLESNIAKIPGVSQVQTRLQFTAQVDLPDVRQPLTGAIVGLDLDQPRGLLNRVSLRSGTWPEPGRAQVLVHETFADKRALRSGDVVKILLNGRQQTLTISGVALSPEFIFAAAAFGSMDETSFGIFWMDQSRLEAAFDMKGAFNVVSVKLRAGGSGPDVVHRLDTILRPYGSLGAYHRADQPSEKIVSDEIRGQRVFGLVLPAVFLAVAVFILNVVVSRQVSTQRDHIAALKALGYTDRSIIMYYVKLVSLIVLIGLAIGLVVGKWYGSVMTGLYADVFRFPDFEHRITAWVWFVPFTINLVAALAGTLFATRSILSLSPAQAMRPPAPMMYRASLLERLGVGGRSSASANMIFRHMERHPARTSLAIIGIAGAVGILISGTWWRDALDYLIDVQFGQIDRADVHLQFTDSIDAQAIRSLRRLPGVIEAESQRIVAVKLHNAHRTERTIIQGLRPNAKLRRVIDAQHRQIAAPPVGILLGSRLAEKLAIRIGQPVYVEFLDRRSPDRLVTVTGFVDEMMVSSAYMHADVLDKIAGNRRTISWAGLMIDRTRLQEIYSAVKSTPVITGIVVKSELIRHFRENTGRNILIFTTILTVFAGLIAVGVVYNSARISLAERAWEFATLRVLGMTEKEVSSLLIGELAIGLAIGIPVGFAFGWLLAWYLAEAMGHDTVAIPLVIWPRTYAYAGLTMLIAGLSTAYSVRRRLNRLDLIGVLKTRE